MSVKKNEIKRTLKISRQVQDRLNYAKYLPRPQVINFTVPVSAWTLNSSATDEFVYYADINIVGLTADDTAEIDFDKTSKSVVIDANISDEGETFSGKIRIYAANVPADSIQGTASVTKGVN